MLKFSSRCNGYVIWENIFWSLWKPYCQIFRDTGRWIWCRLWYFCRNRSICSRGHQWFYRWYSADIDVWLNIRSRRNRLSWCLIWLSWRIYHSKNYWYDTISVAYSYCLCKYITIKYTISQIISPPSILWEVFFAFARADMWESTLTEVLANLFCVHDVQYDIRSIYVPR